LKSFRRNTISGIFKNTFVQIAVIVWVVAELLPLGWIFMSSFKTDADIVMNPFSFPEKIFFGNYIFSNFKADFTVGIYLRNSVILVVLSLIIILVISLPAAYAISKLKIPGKNVLLVILVGIIAIPMHSLIIPLYYFFVKINIVGTFFAAVLPLVTINAPFAVVILQAYFKEFPDELIDSAKIDGCNNLKAFFRIVLPCSLNSISAVLVISFLTIWNDFFVSLVMLRSNSVRTLALGMMAFKGEYLKNWRTYAGVNKRLNI